MAETLGASSLKVAKRRFCNLFAHMQHHHKRCFYGSRLPAAR